MLLTLFHLEVNGIRIGPALPVFLTPNVTPNVMKLLRETFALQPIGHDGAHDVTAMITAQLPTAGALSDSII